VRDNVTQRANGNDEGRSQMIATWIRTVTT